MKQSKTYQPLTARQMLGLAAPPTWAASVLPCLFALFYCWQQRLGLSGVRGLLLLGACILLQSAVNALNDYFDFVKGTDSEEDFLEESDAVLLYGDVAPKSAFVLAMIYLLLGALLGLGACLGQGIVPVAIGIVGAFVIFLYSGGPLPLSYLPVGELVSGVVMGALIPLGVAACADGELHSELVAYTLPLVLGIALIMMSNNGSDIEKDKRAGRHTLPTYLGRERTRQLYRLLLGVWVLLAVGLPLVKFGATGIISLLLLVFFARRVIHRQGAYTLDPKERIYVMKGIAAANLLVNGAYTAAFALQYAREVFYV